MSAGKCSVTVQQVRRKGLKRVPVRKKHGDTAGVAAAAVSPKAVEDWLSNLGFPEAGKAARKRGVCGLTLPHLGHPGWEELGIPSAVDRAIIMGSVAELHGSSSLEGTGPKTTEEIEETAPEPSLTKASNWQKLKRFVHFNDSCIPVDHKRIWFEKMTRSGKAPEEIKESLTAQMDSYNLLTLLLLATVIPTAAGICQQMRWDDDGWPLSRTRFAYLVFSSFFSFCLYAHFGFSHMASVMVADVSNSNMKLFMESFGITFVTELGSLFAWNFFSFFVWVIFTMIALISENAHWVVWLLVSVGVGLATLLTIHFVSIFMARSGCESRLTFAPYYLRLQVHGGLFSNEPVQLDPNLPQRLLLERLSEKAMQEIHPASCKDSAQDTSELSRFDEDSDDTDENLRFPTLKVEV